MLGCGFGVWCCLGVFGFGALLGDLVCLMFGFWITCPICLGFACLVCCFDYLFCLVYLSFNFSCLVYFDCLGWCLFVGLLFVCVIGCFGLSCVLLVHSR